MASLDSKLSPLLARRLAADFQAISGRFLGLSALARIQASQVVLAARACSRRYRPSERVSGASDKWHRRNLPKAVVEFASRIVSLGRPTSAFLLAGQLHPEVTAPTDNAGKANAAGHCFGKPIANS